MLAGAGLTPARKAAGGSELRELADRPDLLAEVAGLALGVAEGKGDEHHAQVQAVAELCRLAGADEDLVQQWVGEGSAGPGPRRCLRSAGPAVRHGASRRGSSASRSRGLPIKGLLRCRERHYDGNWNGLLATGAP